MSAKTTLILAVLAVAALAVFLRNRVARFVGYLTYRVASVKVRSVGIASTVCQVAIDINNPSGTAVSVQDYRVEIYLKGINGQRSLLASSPVNQLKIPARQSIRLTTDLGMSTVQAARLIHDIAQRILSGRVSELAQRLQDELESQTVVVVKATVMGQLVEKELSW